jgi:ubiquinone/menaquinone biosynthesis C-methylase UbiE
MIKEINLLKKYPKTKRDLSKRGNEKTEEDRIIARRFDKEFFDGDRKNGYGGYYYNSKFWTEVVKDLNNFYKLKNGSKILDIGCGKGFMLFDFMKLNPNFVLEGIDISDYAITNAVPEVKKFLKVGDAKNLPYEDNSFDLVISINTTHNLEINQCKKALSEMERVSRKDKYLIVDAYSNEIEKDRIFAWNLTAKTILSTNEWISLFEEAGYTGHYYWFEP